MAVVLLPLVLVLGVYLGFQAVVPWALVLLIANVGLFYFLFRCPADCRAQTRQSAHCRNNAKGLLGGCHLQQHKRQALRKLAFDWPGKGSGGGFKVWLRENTRGLWSSPRQAFDTLGAVGSVVAAVIAVGGVVVTL